MDDEVAIKINFFIWWHVADEVAAADDVTTGDESGGDMWRVRWQKCDDVANRCWQAHLED